MFKKILIKFNTDFKANTVIMFSKEQLKDKLYADFMQRVIYFDFVENSNWYQISDGYYTVEEFLKTMCNYNSVVFKHDTQTNQFYVTLNRGLVKYQLYNIDEYLFGILKEIISKD